MLLSDLKKICAAYHQKTTGDLTVDSVDLFLVAANNARKQAEMLHNFELARVFGTLDVDGTDGGALSTVSLTNTSFGGAVVGSGATGSYTGYNTTWRPIGTHGGGVLYAAKIGNADLYYLGYIVAEGGWVIAHAGDFPSTSANGFLRVTADATTPAGAYTNVGAATGTYIITDHTQTYSGIKEIKAVFRTRADGTLVPIDFSNPEVPLERDRRELEFFEDYQQQNRYPSDAQLLMAGSSSGVIQRNKRLYIYPGDSSIVEPVTLTLECYGWLSDYTSSELSDTQPTDFFLEHGAEYMQWACICELNYLYQTFVQRNEGNLAAPERKAEMAFQKLLTWDAFMVDSNTTRSR